MTNSVRLQRRMESYELDGIVATTLENVCYATGIYSVALDMFPHAGHCFAIISRDRIKEPYFISSKCEVDQFLDAVSCLSGALAYGSFYREDGTGAALTAEEMRLRRVSANDATPDEPLDALVIALRELGLVRKRIALDEDGIRPWFASALAERMPGLDIVDGAEHFRWVRKVKTDAELQRVTEAAAVAEQSILAAEAVAREGAAEIDLVREFERTVVSLGGRPRFSLIKIGRGAVAGQTKPRPIPLLRGDVVWFDVGLVYNGYWADIARICALGEPANRMRTLYDAVLAGENAAISQARPGMTGKELFDLTVEAVRAAGIPNYRRHHVGHGIGVEVYDQVLITPTTEDELEEGTVVNIETPYYEFGLGSVHVEDPFVVGRSGNRLLTTLDRGLHIIG